MKKLLFVIITLLLLSLSIGASDILSFNYAFIYMDNDKKIHAVDPFVQQNKDSNYKFIFEPVKNVYIYLILLDSYGDLMLLHPDSMDNVNKMNQSGVFYSFPEGEEQYFSLDDQEGDERFYIIACTDRKKKLESLMKKYLNKKDGSKDKEVIKHDVLGELKILQQEVSKFKVLAEKPISFSGTVRGIKDEMEKYAINVKAKKLYFKIIKLTH